MRTNQRSLRLFLASFLSLTVMFSLGVVVSGPAGATSGSHGDEVEVDDSKDHEDGGECDHQAFAVQGDTHHGDGCDDDGKDEDGKGDDEGDHEGGECVDPAEQFAAQGGVHHGGDCDDGDGKDECVDLSLTAQGGGQGGDDCDDGGEDEDDGDKDEDDDGKDDDDECVDLTLTAQGGDHDDDECDDDDGKDDDDDGKDDDDECVDLTLTAQGGDHDDDECEDDGDDGDDEVEGTSTTTTSTTLPAQVEDPELVIPALGAVCLGDIPYFSYAIEFPGATSASITFINPVGADIVYPDVPLSGQVLWPGANDAPPDWPGWILDEDGRWVAADDGFLWARETIQVVFEVNPTATLSVSYPQATSACADPENPPVEDEVGGVVITPPPADVAGPVEVLPLTGSDLTGVVVAGMSALILGLLLLGAARGRSDEG